jgi:hydroxyethylthiazole kinase-like uncharacterized protein yjeF
VQTVHEPAAWPVHRAEATRSAERAAAARNPQPALMTRAGEAVARLGRALAPHAQRTVVLAGPGNNGGDGLVAARLLHTARHPVFVRLVGDAGRLPADAARAWRLAQGAGVQISAFQAGEHLGLGPHDLAIDALLGIGSHRAPEGAMAAAIAALNDTAGSTLAVDLPSGLHPDTGTVLGAEAVRARATLALLTIKPGCLTGQGRDHTGQLSWNDLGQALGEPSACLTGHPPRTLRPHAAHKGSFGDVWLLGGATGMEGALVLAAGAALAAGAGRVLACPLATGAASAIGWRPELMLRPATEALKPAVLAQATVVAGCGGGAAIADALPALLEHAARLVLDADALNHIAAQHGLQTALQWRARRGLPTVLTPHPLEAARLLAQSRDRVQADRLGAAQALAERFQAVVVLKGSGTVIAAPDALPAINPTGNAALGTAGTGDVLAGWLGGLWSQAAAGPGAAGHPAPVACAAVWWHGHAADLHLASGLRGPLRAADLIEALVQVRG